jgi:uncharacterized protein (TIGR02145 family)
MKKNIRATSLGYNQQTLANNVFFGKVYQWHQAMYLPDSYSSLTFQSYKGSGATSRWQGICPKGWHLPSDAEWYTLEKYLDSGVETKTIGTNVYYADQVEGSNDGWKGAFSWADGVGAKLMCTAAGLGYNNATLNNCTDAAGGTVAPKLSLGGWKGGGTWSDGTVLWSASQSSAVSAMIRQLSSDSSQSARYSYAKSNNNSHHFSVRCIKD